jgi:hypothetical protein
MDLVRARQVRRALKKAARGIATQHEACREEPALREEGNGAAEVVESAERDVEIAKLSQVAWAVRGFSAEPLEERRRDAGIREHLGAFGHRTAKILTDGAQALERGAIVGMETAVSRGFGDCACYGKEDLLLLCALKEMAALVGREAGHRGRGLG